MYILGRLLKASRNNKRTYIYSISLFHHVELEVEFDCQHMYYIPTMELYGIQMNGVYF